MNVKLMSEEKRFGYFVRKLILSQENTYVNLSTVSLYIFVYLCDTLVYFRGQLIIWLLHFIITLIGQLMINQKMKLQYLNYWISYYTIK